MARPKSPAQIQVDTLLVFAHSFRPCPFNASIIFRGMSAQVAPMTWFQTTRRKAGTRGVPVYQGDGVKHRKMRGLKTNK